MEHLKFLNIIVGKLKYVLLFILLIVSLLSYSQITGDIIIDKDKITFSKYNNYDIIKYEDYYIQELGYPKLPVIIKSFVVPINANNININITNIIKHKCLQESLIYPVQPEVSVSHALERVEFFSPDSIIYNSKLGFPNNHIEMIADDYEFGYHIITFKICPFEYIPNKKELYICDMSYNIEYQLNETERYQIPQNQSLHRSRLTKELIISKVENKEDICRFENKNSNINGHFQGSIQSFPLNEMNTYSLSQANNSLEKIVPDYIIITNEKLKPSFKHLANWKMKKGVPSILITIEEIEQNYEGSDSAEKLRNYLKSVYNKWGSGLFVLLGGGSSALPVRFATNGPDRRDTYANNIYTKDSIITPQDLYFAALEGNWNLNNNHIFNEYYNYLENGRIVRINVDAAKYGRYLHLGRAPVNDSIEASIFVDKVLSYEKANDDIDYSYLNNSMAADAFISKENNVLYNDARSIIDSYYNTYTDTTKIKRWLIFDHFNCEHPKYTYNTRSPGEELNRINFLSALQDGGNSGLNYFHLIYHMDHSNPVSLGTSSKDKSQSIDNFDVGNLINGKYYSIMVSGGCNPATFTKDCIATKFLTNPNGGAVAFIGNADRGWSGEYTQFKELLRALYNKTGSNTAKRYDLGYIYEKAIFTIANNNCRLTLLGDPEMPIWTDIPQDLNVTITPDTIVNGINQISVTIHSNIPDSVATICLMKGDEAYAVVQAEIGQPQIFQFTPRTPGEVDVTITAHNYRPYEKTIPVVINVNPSVYISNLTFDDNRANGAIGNGDGQIDAGESIIAAVKLKNSGSSSVNNLRATLVCTSPDIQMVGPANSPISIAPNATQTIYFYFNVNNDIEQKLKNDLNPVKFLLDMVDGSGRIYKDDFNIDVFASQIERGNQEITLVTRINPGIIAVRPNQRVSFTVELTNNGKAQATGLKAMFVPTTPTVVCTYNQGFYPSIGQYQSEKNIVGYHQEKLSYFEIQTAVNYVAGQPIQGTLIVENEYGRTWSFDIDLLDRPTQIAASTIQYTAHSDAIDLFWSAVTHAIGYNVYASNSEYGGYEKLNTFPLAATYFKEEGLTPYYTRYYRLSALSAKGNESPLSTALKAWTTCPSVGLFPVTMSDGNTTIRSGMLAVDVDHDGKKEIFAGGFSYGRDIGYIFGFNPDGSEMYNLDGNVTSYSGFAKLEAQVTASPAIGDLKATGEMQVVTGSWGTPHLLSCYSTLDKNGDNTPDLMWIKEPPAGADTMKIYRNVVLANLDNSGDGSMEIVAMGCEGSPIKIFDADGNLLRSFGETNSYAVPAVADLDGDGDMEIIVGWKKVTGFKDENGKDVYNTETSLQIWHHDGTIMRDSILYNLNGQDFSCSPIVCDLNKDGQKEILIATRGGADSYLHVISTGTGSISGWDGSQSIAYPIGLDHMLSVGDINGDGHLEVVALGHNVVKAWRHDGTLLFSRTIENLFPAGSWDVNKSVAIIADVNGDTKPDMIFKSADRIYAIDYTGADIVGFPIQIEGEDFLNSVCVADIDNDGYNELIAGSLYNFYVWKTLGSPDHIEWGSERHNPQHTGEYTPICKPAIIRTNTIWDNSEEVCGNIIVQSGTLTINNSHPLTLPGNSLLIIKEGGTLKVDGGTINNASIKAMPGSSLTLTNNAKINLRLNGKVFIDKGAQFRNYYGRIE